jgi:hypothetical protein
MAKIHQTQKLTAERLREVLDYDAATGIFTWRVRRGPVRAGTVAGSVRATGYRYIKVDGFIHVASRLARFWVTGEYPETEVDHRNRDRADDRFINLHPATHSQNMFNKSVRRDNALGAKGVCWRGDLGKYRAMIWDGERQRHLGYFSNLADAIAARNKAAAELHGEFVCPSRDPEHPPLQVQVVKYGSGPLPEPRSTIASDGTVVDVSCIRYATEEPAT